MFILPLFITVNRYTTDVTFKSKWFPSSRGTVENHVHSKAWRKWTVYWSLRRAGALLKKLLQVRARDHVTEAKIFGIFTLYFTTSNCVIDKSPGRDKGKQVRWNKKQDCSIWHGDDQLFHNKPLHFEGGFILLYCYSRGWIYTFAFHLLPLLPYLLAAIVKNAGGTTYMRQSTYNVILSKLRTRPLRAISRCFFHSFYDIFNLTYQFGFYYCSKRK